MRHQRKIHQLGRPQDQRKALLRTLATSLFMYGEIKTTMAKAKALKEYAEHIITLGKRGDLHARRQAIKLVYDLSTENLTCAKCEKAYSTKEHKDEKCECGEKLSKETVVQKLFSKIGPNYAERNGGYTRIYRLPPRRGDAAEMALIQLV
ncbi:MAG: 50S ribosomal protein L17 [Candidatus Melainabacteria bacterium RIFOXYA12_FULL_32_12]|nr:MAG: 50S ribosomal protein L17 [Candidatus Melainabacteria bacterium RIFOXYA2_FULL_32_9]OGI24176.1 MAG: 50S ribosomal protein L17 [Candidatus Melainabacteria bacterium RIFOXYA12_FULL_32_12]